MNLVYPVAVDAKEAVLQGNPLDVNVPLAARAAAASLDPYVDWQTGKAAAIPEDVVKNVFSVLRAAQMQSKDRLARDEGDGSNVVVRGHPFLLEAIVRPGGSGPISFRYLDRDSIVDTHGHGYFLRAGLLLCPGERHRVWPEDAVLLGRRLTPGAIVQQLPELAPWSDQEPAEPKETP